jgi:hypothetical protein
MDSYEQLKGGGRRQYVAENALFIFTPGIFPLNCGDMSDEHGKRIHRDISVMEHRYKGKWSAAMLDDYCWMMKRDAPETKYHRQAKRDTSLRSLIFYSYLLYTYNYDSANISKTRANQ